MSSKIQVGQVGNSTTNIYLIQFKICKNGTLNASTSDFNPGKKVLNS